MAQPIPLENRSESIDSLGIDLSISEGFEYEESDFGEEKGTKSDKEGESAEPKKEKKKKKKKGKRKVKEGSTVMSPEELRWDFYQRENGS